MEIILCEFCKMISVVSDEMFNSNMHLSVHPYQYINITNKALKHTQYLASLMCVCAWYTLLPANEAPVSVHVSRARGWAAIYQ